jgi:ubiquinone/menaquinone biosynthesis C-methylase UbiE
MNRTEVHDRKQVPANTYREMGRWRVPFLGTNRVISRDDSQGLDLRSRVQLEGVLTDGEAARKTRVRPIISYEAFEEYRKHSPWKKFLFDFLGPLEGKTVLDIGCGYNPTPVYFALAGAKKVYACDVSPKAVAYQQRLAEEAGVADRVSGLVSSVEQLPLPSEHVNLVHGEAAIHHLCLPLAGPEIARVLKSGGKGGFKDPLGHNPILEFVRDYLPYAWKAPAKGTDRPLKYEDLEAFGRNFARPNYLGFCFISMVSIFLLGRGHSRARKVTDRLDEWILSKLSFLRRYCRYVVTCVEK